MSSFDWINRTYNLSVEPGQRVKLDGRLGVVKKVIRQYVGMEFDDALGDIVPCHPAWKIEYNVEAPPPPRLTAKKRKSKERYQRYLEYDWFNSFREFLAWDGRHEHSWNRGF